jgi:hypothetical protein
LVIKIKHVLVKDCENSIKVTRTAVDKMRAIEAQKIIFWQKASGWVTETKRKLVIASMNVKEENGERVAYFMWQLYFVFLWTLGLVF